MLRWGVDHVDHPGSRPTVRSPLQSIQPVTKTKTPPAPPGPVCPSLIGDRPALLLSVAHSVLTSRVMSMLAVADPTPAAGVSAGHGMAHLKPACPAFGSRVCVTLSVVRSPSSQLSVALVSWCAPAAAA
jgi:hypothetical protein